MDTSASNRRLRVLLTAIGDGTLIPQPDFQRRLVWTNKDKVEFIKTVLQGFPFPEIYIAAGDVDTKTGKGTEVLVDGQQRITTLYQYFKAASDLKVGSAIPPYADLEQDAQIAFLEYKVVVRDLGSMPLDEIKEVFQRINSTSYGLNAMEIHNARYGGEFKAAVETLSEDEFFSEHKVFTSSDFKRMNDVMYCAGLVATMMSGYFNRDKEIEAFLERYNESFPEKARVLSEAKTVLSFIESLNFLPKSRAFKKADFFTLFVEVHSAIFREKLKLDVSATRRKLDAFYTEVEISSASGGEENSNPDKYYKAALQASNDRSSRILRGEIIGAVLRA